MRSIKLKFKNLTLCLTILMLSLANITLTSALSHQTETDISFTFNPTISISLSSSDLVIPSLTPGTTAESNSINVSVATNAAYGYTLSATVGNNTYNNSNLNHSNNTDTFSSIATSANLSTLDTDNTWGYTTSLDSGSTWSNYNGLSNSSNKKLLDIDTNISSTIGFKIAAKANNTQASGTYSNTINFIAIARVSPKTIADLEYLQDFANLDAENLASVKSSMSAHQTHTLKDKRDEQAYTIAKLNDGKIWMTKNLNLAGGTEITSELSDIPENYTLPTANGFQEGNKLPASSQEGFSDNTQAYVYNTGNDTDNCTNPGCYSYYSWHAATAGSGANITASNTDALHSICPKGWKLPTSGTRKPYSSYSDFYNLAITYGMNSNDTFQSNTSAFYDQAGPNSIPDFLIGNFLYANSYRSSNVGYYWSSTTFNTDSGFFLSFSQSSIDSSNRWSANEYGYSIRCLVE